MRRALHLATRALGVAVWASAGLFGLYILFFYLAAAALGQLERWNRVLPLFDTADAAGNAGMGVHLLGGAVLLLLGNLQLVASLRQRAPVVHRWSGRLYVLGAAGAGTGGLVFIATRGCVGGPIMDVAFGLYGVLMLTAAAMTLHRARRRELDAHRAWAIRLYALAIGSWLYRMDYGFWLLLTDGLGHADGFSGPFDYFMDFAFYLPNLVVAEAVIRSRGDLPAVVQGLLAALMAVATLFIALGTYFFATEFWIPGILAVF